MTGEFESVPNDEGVSWTRALFITIALAVACAAAVACGCPWGLSADGIFAQLMVYAWIGLCLAIPVALAAWAVLREQHRMLRLVVPAVLLMVFIGASKVGERWNHSENIGALEAADVFVLFVSGCLVFFVARVVLGWRLGPLFAGDPRLRLAHLFLWTGIAAFAFAVIAWAQIEARDFAPSAMAGATAIAGVVVAALGLSSIGLVLDVPKRRRVYLFIMVASFVPVIGLTVVSYRAGARDQASLLAIPATCCGFLMWCFACYQGCGYRLVRNDGQATGSKKGLGWPIALLGVSAIALYAWVALGTLAEQRSTKAFQASWAPLGVYPISRDERLVTGVLFQATVPLTNKAVEALAGQPLTYAAIWNNVPEVGSLRKLASVPSMDRIELEGGKITNAHLQELYEANNLKDIVLNNVTALTAKDIEQLRDSLPNCKVVSN